VYGNPSYLPVDENHPTEPLVSYGVTRLAIEKYLLLHQYLHGVKATILRVSNPFGQRQRVETAQGVVAAFLSKALNGEPVEIWGDGTVVRDYIYVSDVAEAFARAIAYEGHRSVFNISTGVGTSLNELIDLVERVVGRTLVKARAIVVLTLLCQVARTKIDGQFRANDAAATVSSHLMPSHYPQTFSPRWQR
jgi:UDP-glucose 4-epimerase